MPWKAKWYGQGLVSAFGGPTAPDARCIDWLSDTIKVSLHTSSSNAASAAATLAKWADVTNEISATGYTAGGNAVGGKTVTYDLNTAVVQLMGNTVKWTGTVNFTTPAYAVVYDSTPADKPVLGYVDFGSTIHGQGHDNTNYGLVPYLGAAAAGIYMQFRTFSTGNTLWYRRAWGNVFGGYLAAQARCTDWLSDTIKISLHDSSYVPNLDVAEVYADLSGELAGGGYTAGGNALAGKTVAFGMGLTVPGLALGASNLTFSALTQPDIRWAVIYNSTPADKPLLGLIDLGGTGCDGEDLRLLFHSAAGLLNMRAVV